MTAAQVKLHAAVAAVAKSFKVFDGRLAMPVVQFKEACKAIAAVPATEGRICGRDLVALAVRFEREAGADAGEAVAQLYALAAGVMGKTKAKAAFKAAGVGWGAKGARK